MFPHGGSANELTRWATAASLVENGSFEISWTEPLIGKKCGYGAGRREDLFQQGPRDRCLAAPLYALRQDLCWAAKRLKHIRTRWFVMRLFIGHASTSSSRALARKGADEFSWRRSSSRHRSFSIACCFSRTSLLPCSSISPFACFTMPAALLLKRCFWAGLLSGVAVTSEFSAIFAIFVFAAGLLFTGKRERYRRLSYFILGGAPFALLLLLYNNSLFGSPFSISYAHESFPEWAGVRVRAFRHRLSDTQTGFCCLSPARGLLFLLTDSHSVGHCSFQLARATKTSGIGSRFVR